MSKKRMSIKDWPKAEPTKEVLLYTKDSAANY